MTRPTQSLSDGSALKERDPIVRKRDARWGRHLFASAILSLVTLALTWPLAIHFQTHVPGNAIDDPALVWNLWWIKVRLVDQLQFDIFHSDRMFYPLGINLAFYTLTLLNGLLSIPLQTAFGLVSASNLLLFL